MIPGGWERTTIGKHVEVLTGYAFKSSDYSNGPDDLRLLRGDNVAQHRIRWRDAQKLPQEKARGLDRFALRLGDFVIALDRTWIPAGVKIAEITEADLPSLLVQRVARLRSKPSLEQSLMRQFFSGHGFEQYVKSVQTETAVPHISPNDLRDLPILLPPLPEQKWIAEALETWDRAIATVEALIANARAHKQALMQQLLPQGATLPKKRFPGYSGEWRETTLEALAKVVMGSSPPSSAYNENLDGLPLIQGNADIQDRLSCPRMYTSEITQTCEPDDILFSVRAPVGEISISGHRACIGRGIAAIRPRSKGDFDFLYFRLLGAEPTWSRLSQGSTFQAVNSKDLKGFVIMAPSDLPERLAIGGALRNSQLAEDCLQSQLTALRQEKAALMQQLLTGKRRVKLPESWNVGSEVV